MRTDFGLLLLELEGVLDGQRVDAVLDAEAEDVEAVGALQVQPAHDEVRRVTVRCEERVLVGKEKKGRAAFVRQRGQTCAQLMTPKPNLNELSS